MKVIGTISVAAGASVNNLNTAVPFNIPIGCNYLALLASGAGITAKLTPGTVALTAAATDVALPTTQYQMPGVSTAGLGVGSYPNVLALFNTTGGALTCQVAFVDASC